LTFWLIAVALNVVLGVAFLVTGAESSIDAWLSKAGLDFGSDLLTALRVVVVYPAALLGVARSLLGSSGVEAGSGIPSSMAGDVRLARLPWLRENVVDGVGAVASWLAVVGSPATAGVVYQPEIWRGHGRTRCGGRAGTRPRD
jgi:hypothetical protein